MSELSKTSVLTLLTSRCVEMGLQQLTVLYFEAIFSLSHLQAQQLIMYKFDQSPQPYHSTLHLLENLLFEIDFL